VETTGSSLMAEVSSHSKAEPRHFEELCRIISRETGLTVTLVAPTP